MALTDLKIRKMKPKAKPFKLTDGENLVLVVRPTGSKTFKQRVYHGGRERDVTLGTYPDMTLTEARRAAAEIRDTVARGIDPLAAKRRTALRTEIVGGDTFRDVTEAYMASKTKWVEAHRKRFCNRMTFDVFPIIGDMPIAAVEPLDVVAAVRPIADREAVYTAKRTLGFIGQVITFATTLGLRSYGLPAGLAATLGDAPPERHRPALMEPDDLGGFLRALWGRQTRAMDVPIVKACLYTFARAGEVRHMRWDALDLENREWVYHATKVDLRQHIVPLSDQMLALIEAQRRVNGGREYVFAGRSGRVVSDVVTGQLIGKLGYKGSMTAHGARALARTVLVERLGWPEGPVDLQLSHMPKDVHGHAYNRVTWRADRHVMMQSWADWLDGVRAGGEVVALAAE